MELRHLRYFVAVAEELHFSRAAERIGIAQPPLSQQIRQLEEEIGVRLFYRNQRKVTLTAAGELLLRDSRQILQLAEEAKENARRAERGEIGTLVIAFVSSATYGDFMPSVIRDFRERYPKAELKLLEKSTTEQTAAIVAGTVHVGFVRPPISDRKVETETVLKEPILAALPIQHELAKRTSIALSELSDQKFIMLPRNMGLNFYDQTVSLCRDAGFNPEAIQEASEIHTIIGLVATGMGVALVPASIVNLNREGVAYMPLMGIHPEVELAIAWKSDVSIPILSNFLDVVWEHASRKVDTLSIN
jgi:DNA-binding transcriptional LysR family regulator